MKEQEQEVLLSVVVAAYGHEKYIEKAIRSILMQKVNFAFEVLIGEDCSPDGTRDVLKQLEPELPENYHLFYREKNIGAAANFNDLYSRTKGKYFIILEGDDYWTDSNKLQMQIDFLESHPDYIAVAHNTLVVDKNDNLHPTYIYPECKDSEYTLQHYLWNILAGQTTTIVCRNFMKNELFPIFTPSFNYPGDRVNNFMYPAWGKVHCIQKVMSAYRYVTDEGFSFSAQQQKQSLHESKKKERNFFGELYNYSVKQVGTKESISVSGALYCYCTLRGWLCSSDVTFSMWWKVFKSVRYKRFAFVFILKKILRKVLICK